MIVVLVGGITNSPLGDRRSVNACVLTGGLGEDQADLGPVGPDLADRRVVDLEDQVGAGRDLLGRARG